MGKKFAEYSKLDLSEVNGKVLKKWDENQVFAKSMTEREGCPSFVFFEGPPSANGMPGIHHVMARSIKDIYDLTIYDLLFFLKIARKGFSGAFLFILRVQIYKKVREKRFLSG